MSTTSTTFNWLLITTYLVLTLLNKISKNSKQGSRKAARQKERSRTTRRVCTARRRSARGRKEQGAARTSTIRTTIFCLISLRMHATHLKICFSSYYVTLARSSHSTIYYYMHSISISIRKYSKRQTTSMIMLNNK